MTSPTSVLNRPAAPSGVAGLARAVPRRRLKVAIAGGLTMFVSGFIFLTINIASSERVRVLVVDRAVAAGSTITERDIRTVEVSPTDGAKFLGTKDRDELLRSTARIGLSPGTPLSQDLVQPAGDSPVTVAAIVRPGNAPALAIGDDVTIIATTNATTSLFGGGDNGLGKNARTIGTGKVKEIRPGSNAGDVAVSLDVDRAISADVAAASSAGGVVLVAGTNPAS